MGVTAELPSHSQRLLHLGAVVLCNEILFFYSHWAMHLPAFYARFHKQHHEFTSPIGLVAIYCHPVEFVLCDLIPLTAGLLLCRAPLFTVYMWCVSAVIGTQIHHSGS